MKRREAVERFADEMERRLQANDHKGGWQSERKGYLLSRLREEVEELYDAMVVSEADGAGVTAEAADVANFAMMIADNFGRWTR